jgi:hypothetical protein
MPSRVCEKIAATQRRGGRSLSKLNGRRFRSNRQRMCTAARAKLAAKLKANWIKRLAIFVHYFVDLSSCCVISASQSANL